jgi:sec-independent protein translocase protein TatC
MKVRPIGHEDRLSIIDHLDELRTRIFICAGVLIVAFAFCFWQNTQLLSILNRALPDAAKTGLGAQPHEDANLHHAMATLQVDLQALSAGLAHSKGVSASAVSAARNAAAAAGEAKRALPKSASQQEKPITIGVSESFTTTIMVVAYFALLISLPILLYQLYAFIIPALSRDERRIALPAMIAAPLLFVAGVVFTYFAVLPPAVHFLQGYNSSHFQNLVQAKSYYSFELLIMLALGLAFQVPLVLLGLQKLGVINARTLTVNWRYAVVIIAIIGAALPAVDPVTTALECAPLLVLYVASIILLRFAEYRTARRERQHQHH